MTGLYDSRDSETIALQNIAPGSPAGYSENFDAAWEDTERSQNLVSARDGIYDAYDRYVKDIEEKTGEKLFNPVGVWQPGGRRDEVLAKHEGRLFERLADIKKRFPDIELRTPESIREEVAKERAAARKSRANVGERSTGFAAGLGNFLGEAGATIVDPPVLMSMFAGAPLASGILRTALIEAGIAGAVEIPIQIAVQNDRRQFGEQPSFDEGVSNVLAATAGGAIFGGGMRAAFVGTRKLIETARASEAVLPRQARDALNFLSRKQEMEDDNPFVEGLDGQRTHAERYSGAYEGIRRGSPSAVPDEVTAQVRARADTPAEPEVRTDVVPEEIEAAIVRLGRDASRQAEDVALEKLSAVVPTRTIRARDGDVTALLPDENHAALLDYYFVRERSRRTGEQMSLGEMAKDVFERFRPYVFDDFKRPGDVDQLASDYAEMVFDQVGSGKAPKADLTELTVVDPDHALAYERRFGRRQRAPVVNRQALPPSEPGMRQGAPEPIPIRTGTARTIADARVEQERMRGGEIDKEDHILETTLRADLAERMDETVMMEDAMGEIRPMTIREIFDEFDDDETLLREFLDCAGLGS